MRDRYQRRPFPSDGIGQWPAVREHGPGYLPRAEALEGSSDALVLARLLALGVPRARRLLEDVGGWLGLAGLTTNALTLAHGLTRGQAARLQLALEIGRRLPFPPARSTQIATPADVAALLTTTEAWEQEQFWVLTLTTQHAVVAVETLYTGTLDRISIRPAEVFRGAIRANAAAIVVAHAQPSGEPHPSPEDLQVTRELLAAGTLLDVPLLDHLILGGARWVSLREHMPGMWAGQ